MEANAGMKDQGEGMQSMTHDTEFPNETDGTPAAEAVFAAGGLSSPVATVEAVMTRAIITIDMDAPLHKIQRIFQCEGLHHLLVIEAGELIGVISDRDLLSALSPYLNTPSEQRRDERTLHRRAHHIMSRRLVTVTRATPIAHAAALLLKHGIGCLPVVSTVPVRTYAGSHLRLVTIERTIEGIVTWRDIMAYYLGFDVGV